MKEKTETEKSCSSFPEQRSDIEELSLLESFLFQRLVIEPAKSQKALYRAKKKGKELHAIKSSKLYRLITLILRYPRKLKRIFQGRVHKKESVRE